MRCPTPILLLLLAGGTAFAADQEYYRRYLNLAATNDQSWQLTSPLLVDTNNVGYKLTNVLLQLSPDTRIETWVDTNGLGYKMSNVLKPSENLRTTGALAGVRPGMTMEQVIGQWGKPLQVWAKGFGGPRFVYKEVSVFFEPSGNSVRSIFTHNLTGLMNEMRKTPKTEACLTALGPPDYRDEAKVGSQSFLIYLTTNAVLKVGCVRGRLNSIQADKPAD